MKKLLLTTCSTLLTLTALQAMANNCLPNTVYQATFKQQISPSEYFTGAYVYIHPGNNNNLKMTLGYEATSGAKPSDVFSMKVTACVVGGPFDAQVGNGEVTGTISADGSKITNFKTVQAIVPSVPVYNDGITISPITLKQ